MHFIQIDHPTDGFKDPAGNRSSAGIAKSTGCQQLSVETKHLNIWLMMTQLSGYWVNGNVIIGKIYFYKT